jgi:hypothetical protein
MKAKEMKEPKKDYEKESHDLYQGVITMLGNRHRLILCRDGIQRIIQKTAGKGWQGFSYHTDVVSLKRRLASLGLDTSCTDTMVPVRELNL